MSLVYNERTKLTANLLNTAAATFLAAGVIAPVVAYFYGFGENRPSGVGLLFGMLVWFLTGVMLHWSARRMLRRLIQ